MPENQTPLNQALQRRREELAAEIVQRQHKLHPNRWDPSAEEHYQKSLRDAGYHLDYLAQAAGAESPTLFRDYIAWVKEVFSRLGFSEEVLPTTLDLTRQVLKEHLAPDAYAQAERYLAAGQEQLAHADSLTPSALEGDHPLIPLAQEYLELLLDGSRDQASRLILQAVEDGVAIPDLYLHVFQRTQHEIGRLWQINEISVAHEHYCTAATQLIMSQLYPQILSSKQVGRSLVMTCVNDELHELGARMVADFFEMEGWDTHYLGANTPAKDIISTLEERQPDLLGISTTITFHLEKMSDLIQSVKGTSPINHIPILVGGRPFNIDPELWRRVGADGGAADARGAIRMGSQLAEAAG